MQQLLTDALRRAEKLFGQRESVIDGEVRLTYAEFGRRVRQLGGGLRHLGVRPGERVATLMLNGHRYLEAYFAVPGIGAVLVPLNNRLAEPEQRYILEDAGVSVLIVDAAHAERGEALADCVKEVVVAPEGYEALLASDGECELGAGVREDDLAGIFYTGGTTGAAKGVMLTHRNLVANSLHMAIAIGYRSSDTYLHALPMFHLGDGAQIFPVTWIGGRHVSMPVPDPTEVLRLVETEGVSCTVLVPTVISAMVHHPDVGTADLGPLRMIVHGGAPIASELLRTAIGRLGCSFAQGYGMTEASSMLTFLGSEENLLEDPRLRSVGREAAGVEVTVRRSDGNLCAIGEVGELVARGPNFSSGYWNKPDETSGAFRDGWYWTGDLGYADDDQFIFVVDRLKDMIISGGENVYSIEVEDALMAHEAVLEVSVIGVPDERLGERVHAVVVFKPGRDADEASLRDFCRDRIAGYKCPRSIEFRSDPLPRSGANKVLKKELRAPYWSGSERAV